MLLAEAGLPRPETQVFISGVGRVDFVRQIQRLVVETDGFAFHSDRKRYHGYRRRGNALVRMGWRVLRFSWENVVHHPADVVDMVSAVLGVERQAA